MESAAARDEPAAQEQQEPLDAERDSRLPPGAPWHRARIARIPVPGESYEDRIIRQRRWIFARHNLPSPDDNPFSGLVFDSAINYHHAEWGDPVPQHVWELRAWKQFDLCVNQRDNAKGWGRGVQILRCCTCGVVGSRARPLGKCCCCEHLACEAHLESP
eukprot:4968306-Amphidinium_carterae.1